MRASVKGKYDASKTSGTTTLVLSSRSDLKFGASITDGIFAEESSLVGSSLTVEKPGSFIIDYDLSKKDFRFQFMNSVKVFEKKLNTNYIHSRNENRTVLDGSLVLDPANKFSANHVFGSRNGKLKYTYVHDGVTTFEPCYDVAKNSWDFAVSQKVYDDDVFKVSYQTSSKMLGLDWWKNTNLNGSFKISASIDMSEEIKMPKLIAETTWNIDM